jgi:hypothetical protein
MQMLICEESTIKHFFDVFTVNRTYSLIYLFLHLKALFIGCLLGWTVDQRETTHLLVDFFSF